VVVSADNAQCRLSSEEGVGACADIDSPHAIAEALVSILGQPAGVRRELRAHCRSIALDRYSWERNVAGLTSLYRGLAETRPIRA
jgi:glycosyltransferase involved in cell wall biosynthesis